MPGRLDNLVSGANFDDLPEIHHGNPVGNVPHRSNVVRHEQIGQVELRLEFPEQFQNLRLDRHVQRRYGFVADHQVGS